MATTPKRIQRIQGPISALNAGQIGVEDTVDADLGFRMHGGKDGAGGVTKWLAKDKPARVSEMTVQDLGAGAVVSDATGRLSTAVIPGFQDLQSVMETGSTATIDTDIEVSVVKDAPLSGINNPIHVRENIRNSGTLGATERAAQMRRRAEGQGGTSYSESNQTAMESNSARDFISDIAAVDGQTARIRCRVQNGVATITESAQTKTVNLNGDQTVFVEKDVLEGTVTDTETVKNIGLGATTGDVSFAKKVIIVESDNDVPSGLGGVGRVTLTANASNTADYGGESDFSVDTFDGTDERRVVSSGYTGSGTFHKIIADNFSVNGEPQGVQFVTTVEDTPHVMTIASAKKIIFEGSASNAVCELPPANSTATLSDGTVVTMRGRSFELVNASSEFIPVQNSGTASSLLIWVKPGDTAVVTCSGVGSAAGTWKYKKSEPENINDFHGNTLATDALGWNPANGTGASADVDNGVAIAGSVGVLKHTTGTSSATSYSVIRRGPVGCGRAAILIQSRVYPTAQASGAQDFVYEVGLFATLVSPEATNGVFIRLPSNASGKVNWTGHTIAAATPTEVDSSVAYALNTWITVSVLLNSAGTRADFWAGKTYIGKSTTNIPAAGTLLYPGSLLCKTVGTTSISYYVDFVIEDYPAPEAR